MIIQILLLFVGLALVIKGGDLFVDSSVHIARRLHIPRMVIGATIVSLATTAPEMVVSVTASWLGDSGIALGNAVGSAIANIGLIVGVTALIAPVAVDPLSFKRRSLWMIISAVLVILFSWDLKVERLQGLALILIGFSYLMFDYWWLVSGRHKTMAAAESAPDQEEPSLKKSVVIFATGAVLVIAGSRLLVFSGIAIASALGVPSVIIGLTIIAVGTSLPELVTAIASARKGVPELSIGNIIGANVLNLALITGLASVINPLTLSVFTRNYSYSWLIVIIFSMMGIFWAKGKMRWKQGVLLLVFYSLYVVGLIFLPGMLK